MTNNVIDNAFNKAIQYTQSNLLIGENENNIIRIDGRLMLLNSAQIMNLIAIKPILTFSVPYNTNTTHIGSILYKHWHLIDKDPTLKLLWPEPPLVSYKRNHNIKDRIVHSKLSNN
jgi:hypothetical protein